MWWFFGPMSSRHLMAHRCSREEESRGKRRMEWVASGPMGSFVSLEDRIWFLRKCHYIPFYSTSLFNFLHSPVIFSLLGPNVFPSALFSNTLTSCYSVNVRDQVSRQNKTGK